LKGERDDALAAGGARPSQPSARPGATWSVKKQVNADGVVFLAWTADAAGSRAEDGVDTLVFQDGMIRAQTVSYTLQRKG
jgi:hypothetical protein